MLQADEKDMDQLNSVKPSRPHIGSIIKEELERQERSVSWFARKLNCDRSNIYKLFKRSTVDTELLLRISAVLHCNFFDTYKSIADRKIGNRCMD